MTRRRKTAAAPAAPAPAPVGEQDPAALICYIARYYRAVPQDGGDRRIEPGQIVVVNGDAVDAYPPERFVEAFSDIALDTIDLEDEIAD